jgi:hypothetical protein
MRGSRIEKELEICATNPAKKLSALAPMHRIKRCVF